MRAIVAGECLGVTTETRGQGDKAFELTIIHVLAGVDVVKAEKTRDFIGALPVRGEVTALDCSITAWVSSKGNSGLNVKALGRSPLVEDAFSADLAKSS